MPYYNASTVTGPAEQLLKPPTIPDVVALSPL